MSRLGQPQLEPVQAGLQGAIQWGVRRELRCLPLGEWWCQAQAPTARAFGHLKETFHWVHSDFPGVLVVPPVYHLPPGKRALYLSVRLQYCPCLRE